MGENHYKFERLTPTNDVDLEVYKEAINYIFKNSDIKNVAISGTYSAGKSSILESYKRRHHELKFLHISLAHFKSSEQDEDVKESVLEGKILNQLIHQISTERIPQTNFRIKRTIDNKNIIKDTIGIICLCIAILYFIYFKTWKGYVLNLPENQLKWLKDILLRTTNSYCLLLVGVLIIGLISYSLYNIIKKQKNKNIFRKLNLQGNEIEIFEESDDSYFDKYLNEVLYIFENAEADVIVFEDMDRFNANRIFERLREVNTLVNIRLKKENRGVLRFFYLLRDDIFDSKDRTKFFDYIIPVMDSSNSYDQFITLFKNSGVFERLDEHFLQGLSLYIDDMRLLKNIYNEYLIYYNRLNMIELDCNKMLAIICYKNIFPQDFSNLQLNQGFVYTLFSKKDEFVKDEIAELEKRKEIIQKQIVTIKNEHLKSVRELNVVFADKYCSRYNWPKGDEELYDFLQRYLRSGELKEYQERKQMLEDKLEGNTSSFDKSVSDLEQELVLVKNKSLAQIITRNNTDRIFSITNINNIGQENLFNEVKGNEYFDLLKYLISNGFIDETYADYMTYFYENSLTRIDKIFLRSITDKRAKEYTYQLKNPKLIVSRLRLVDFDQEEILNFDLLTYLLQQLSPIEYLERYIQQLKVKENFKFIGFYMDVTTEMSSYIKYLNINWPQLFRIALDENKLTEDQIYRYSIYSLYYSDEDIIQLINQENKLSEYISNKRDYLKIKDPNIDKLITGFNLIGVCFSRLNYKESNKELFYKIYENLLYEINAENLQLMLQRVLGVENLGDILHKNYSILFQHLESPITQYIHQNIEEYMSVVLNMSENCISDEENIVIEVLNHLDVDIEQKKAYIYALETVITSIKDIKQISLWSILLDANKVICSEKNIMDYFNFSKLIDKSIISFINRAEKEFDFRPIDYNDEDKDKLFNCIVKCNDIENSKYKQILESLEFYYSTFDILDIADEKISILIDAEIVRMSSDTLEFIRENYPKKTLDFIKKNMSKYIDVLNNDNNLFVESEILEIITWNIDDEMKLKLLEFTDSEIPIIGQGYSSAVCVYILQNNFKKSELQTFFDSFSSWDTLIQEEIFGLAIENIAKIIDGVERISRELKHKLFSSIQVDVEDKIELFIAMLPSLDQEEIKNIFALLGLHEYTKIFDARKKPKIEINSINENLLTELRENNWIESFVEPKEEGEKYFKIVKKRKNKRK